MNSIDITNNQVPSMILHVLKEQPPEGMVRANVRLHEDKSKVRFIGEPYISSWYLQLPYAVGQVIGCKEPWAYGLDESGIRHKPERYIYKADLSENELELFRIFSGNKWRSPVTMPQEAIRRWVKVTDCDVKRVQEITRKEVRAMGYSLPVSPGDSPQGKEYRGISELHRWLVRDFNAKYAKPKAIRKGGKIVEYVAFSFSENDFDNIYKDDYRYKIFKTWNTPSTAWDYEYTWKGLLLTINANPYVLTIGLEEVEKP